MEKTWRFLGRDGRIPLDDFGENTAKGLDAERKRGHVKEQYILDLAFQNSALDTSADSHDFIRIHDLFGSLPK